MGTALERGAEIVKLARLLGVEPKELDYLADIPAEALRTFRDQVTDRLFAGDAGRLHRVAKASTLVPVPLTVKVAQAAFGPLLCSATAGLLDPKHAVKVAAKCPTGFLADITVTLDPRRAAEVIAAVPTPLVVAVARELIARDEHVTMGRFVSYLSRETLRQAVPAIPDDADILRVAFVMEGKQNLDDLLDVARDRFPGLVRTAYEQDLWAEALDLIGHLSLPNRAELAEIAAAEPDDVLEALVRAAQRLGAWDAVLPIAAAMSPESLRRFADIVSRTDVLGDVIEAALGGALWLDLLPLTRHLSAEARAEVARHTAAKDDAELEQLATAAHDAQLWDALLPIALAFEPADRVRLAGLMLLQREDVLRAAVETAARHGLWDAVLPLAEALPDEAKPRIAASLGALEREHLLAALEAAASSANLPALVAIALRQDAAGRQRVLQLVAELERLEEFAALLTDATPDPVWDALVEVRDELPAAVRALVTERAAAAGRAGVVDALGEPAAAPPRTRPRPGPRR